MLAATRLSAEEHIATAQPATPDKRSATPAQDGRTLRNYERFKLKLKPLAPLFNDEAVEEIMINSASEIFFERQGQIRRYTEASLSHNDILGAINLAATCSRTSVTMSSAEGRQGSALVYSQIDNLRVAAAIHPVAHYGNCLCIRIHRRKKRTLQNYVDDGSFEYLTKPIVRDLPRLALNAKPEAIAEFFTDLMESGASVLVSGTPSGGKSTFLDVLVGLLPKHQRVLVLEDTHEIDPTVPNRLVLISNEQAGVSMRDLVKFSLRARPDWIVVGELRDRAASDFLTAVNSGPKALASIHADSPLDALRKLEALAMQADEGIPHDAIRQQIASCVQVVVHMARIGPVRAPVQALRVMGCNKGQYITEDLFRSPNPVH